MPELFGVTTMEQHTQWMRKKARDRSKTMTMSTLGGSRRFGNGSIGFGSQRSEVGLGNSPNAVRMHSYRGSGMEVAQERSARLAGKKERKTEVYSARNYWDLDDESKERGPQTFEKNLELVMPAYWGSHDETRLRRLKFSKDPMQTRRRALAKLAIKLCDDAVNSPKALINFQNYSAETQTTHLYDSRKAYLEGLISQQRQQIMKQSKLNAKLRLKAERERSIKLRQERKEFHARFSPRTSDGNTKSKVKANAKPPNMSKPTTPSSSPQANTKQRPSTKPLRMQKRNESDPNQETTMDSHGGAWLNLPSLNISIAPLPEEMVFRMNDRTMDRMRELEKRWKARESAMLVAYERAKKTRKMPSELGLNLACDKVDGEETKNQEAPKPSDQQVEHSNRCSTHGESREVFESKNLRTRLKEYLNFGASEKYFASSRKCELVRFAEIPSIQ